MRLCWTQTWPPSRIFYVGCPATTAELSCPKRGPHGLQNCKILSIWLSAEVVCQPLLISVMRLTPKGQTLRSLALHEKPTPTTTDTRVGTIHRLRTTRTVFPLMNHLRMEWPGKPDWTDSSLHSTPEWKQQVKKWQEPHCKNLAPRQGWAWRPSAGSHAPKPSTCPSLGSKQAADGQETIPNKGSLV